MKFVKKYSLFIVIFLAAVLCIIMQNRSLPTPIVSHPDSQIRFSTEQSVLEQTWQPHVKKIASVHIPYTGDANFDSTMELTIYSDDYSSLLIQTSGQWTFREKEPGTMDFDLGKLKVTPGERYRIQLRYENNSARGALLLPSGSNYSGCSIDGKPCGEAAAFELVLVKNSRLFWLFAVFFPFLSFSLLLMTAWNRKWEDCVGLSMIGTVFILYVSGLFEKLSVGMALIYILSVASLLCAAYFYQKKGMRTKDLLSPALFLFGGLFLLILINCSNVWYARVDEYAQWGMAAKDMFYYNSFAKHVNTTVAIPRYLPFTALIEYFFTYANGLFTQELVYVAYQTMLLGVSIVVCGFAFQKWRYCIPAAAVMIGIPIIFYSDVYNCIYVDSLLAVLTAYVLICYFSEEMTCFNLLRILGGLFALTTTKDMGMVIAGLLTIVMMADRLYRALRQKKPVLKGLILPASFAVFVLAAFFSWQIYMSIPAKVVVVEPSQTAQTQNAEGTGTDEVKSTVQEKKLGFQSTASASGITLDGILGLLRHEDGGYRYQTIKNFLIAIFDEESYLFGSIGISYVDMYILMLGLIGGLSLLGFWKERRDSMLSFGVFTFCAGMCYAAVLGLTYLFAFPQGEALILISHQRYLASFLGGVVMALAGLIVRQAAQTEKDNKSASLAAAAILSAGIVICTPMSNFIIKNMDFKLSEDYVYGYEDIAEVLRSFSAKGEKIYFVCNESGGDSGWIFKNTACPLVGYGTQSNLYATEEAYLKQVDIWTQNEEEIREIGTILSCEDWEKSLLKCQYVFILHPNDVFRESYESLFEEPETVGDGTFYRVEKSGDSVTLAFIGQVGIKSYK
ncbi:MAG: hypothetical protein NC419_04920 [Muribaculaceae bacterium]|nr:hypothetical protein [Muribaculaceae bacterium]